MLFQFLGSGDLCIRAFSREAEMDRNDLEHRRLPWKEMKRGEPEANGRSESTLKWRVWNEEDVVHCVA